MIPLPPGPFDLIEADPPWHYVTFDGKSAVPTQGADPYATMTEDELAALPVASVAAPDCVLLMWVISSHVKIGLDLGEAWGFTFKSLGPVWVKERAPNQHEMFDDAPICELGMGHWFRQQAEICLLFTRGSPKRLSAGVRQVIFSPRREHSRKPDIRYERYEKLIGGRKLELFGRQRRPGWEVYGNDVDRFSLASAETDKSVDHDMEDRPNG